MPAIKMAVFARVVTLVGAFAAGVQGIVPEAVYSNGVSTVIVPPQELGSTISAGSLLYSLNMCTIVHSINCVTATSTGAAASTAGPALTGPVASRSESINLAGSVPPAYGSSQPETTPSGGPVSTVQALTHHAGSSPVVTKVQSSYLATRETTESASTQRNGQQTSGSTGIPVPTSTGACNTAAVFRSLVVGVATVALAFF